MKEIKLTKKQEEVLNFIKKYTAKNGFPPAVREIAKGVGLNSPSSVHSHIKRLERDGYISKTNSKFRTLEVVGINEFNDNKNEAIKLDLFEGINIKKTKEYFYFPIDRAEKNVKIFALRIDNDYDDMKKNDIVILSNPKNYEKYDILLGVKDNAFIKYNVLTKNEEIPEDIKIIGKLLELNRRYE